MMRLSLACIVSCGLFINAGSTYAAEIGSTASIFAEYNKFNGKLDTGETTKLTGGAIGISTTPNSHGLWAKFESLSDKDLDVDYYELSAGGQYNFFNNNGFYALGTLGIGYANAESSLLTSDVNFVSLPLGLELGYAVTPRLSTFVGVGYKWLIEITDDKQTRCNDGSYSNSTGSGTCSWHDGVASWGSEGEAQVGDVDGATYNVGLRFNF